MGEEKTRPKVDILLLMAILRQVTTALNSYQHNLDWFSKPPSAADEPNRKDVLIEYANIIKKADLKAEEVEVLTSKLQTAYNNGNTALFNKTIEEEAKDLAIILALYKLEFELYLKQLRKQFAATGRQLPENIEIPKVDELALSLGLTLPSL